MILAVTPARKGSKGIIKKNLSLVNGIPLIQHTFNLVKGLDNVFDHYIVSTDCNDIIDLAKQNEVQVPFVRPAHLAEDQTPMLPVLEHAIIEMEATYNQPVSTLILLDPTAPLRRPSHITDAYHLFKSNDCDAVISCNQPHRHPSFNMVKEESGFAQLVVPLDYEVGSRQTAPKVYDLNTVVWIYKRDVIVKDKIRIPKKTLLYEVEKCDAIDIDYQEDLDYLDYLLQRGHK
tara:strand:+ start:891 stop:1586 length:696 start_codon:yes stop_codon:yes gene_type:complete